MGRTYEKFGEYLRTVAGADSCAQSELVKRTGLSSGTVNGFWNDKDLPGADSLEKILKALPKIDGALARQLIALEQIREEVYSSDPTFSNLARGVFNAVLTRPELAPHDGHMKVDIMVSWLHVNAVTDMRGTLGVLATFLRDYKEYARDLDCQLDLRIITASPSNIPFFCTRFLHRNIDKLRLDELFVLEAASNQIGTSIQLELVEVFRTIEWIERQIEEVKAKQAPISVRHSYNFAHLAYPVILVQNALGVRGNYAQLEGYCDQPGALVVKGNPEFNLMRADFDMCWRQSLLARYCGDEDQLPHGADNQVQMAEEIDDLYIRRNEAEAAVRKYLQKNLEGYLRLRMHLNSRQDDAYRRASAKVSPVKPT